MKSIKQTILIKAPVEKVYEALTNPKMHSEFTGSKAKNTDKLGEFSAYDGYAYGKNILLEKNKKIIQEWSSDDFPKGHYSETTYVLTSSGKNTKLTFTQKNVPDENYDEISSGWEEFYWTPLKKMLEK